MNAEVLYWYLRADAFRIWFHSLVWSARMKAVWRLNPIQGAMSFRPCQVFLSPHPCKHKTNENNLRQSPLLSFTKTHSRYSNWWACIIIEGGPARRSRRLLYPLDRRSGSNASPSVSQCTNFSNINTSWIVGGLCASWEMHSCHECALSQGNGNKVLGVAEGRILF